jgi:hypothetical protein
MLELCLQTLIATVQHLTTDLHRPNAPGNLSLSLSLSRSLSQALSLSLSHTTHALFLLFHCPHQPAPPNTIIHRDRFHPNGRSRFHPYYILNFIQMVDYIHMIY